MRCSVRTTHSGRKTPLLGASPRRSDEVIGRHSWDGMSREQTIEAVSLMHSPGHVRGYTRECARALWNKEPMPDIPLRHPTLASHSLRHAHVDFAATPYRKVANMYPGGAHPEDDPQAIIFMRGLSTVKVTPSLKRGLVLRDRPRSLPRLCTRYVAEDAATVAAREAAEAKAEEEAVAAAAAKKAAARARMKAAKKSVLLSSFLQAKATEATEARVAAEAAAAALAAAQAELARRKAASAAAGRAKVGVSM